LVAIGYPRAKLALVSSGYSPEQVDKMPVGQVVALQQSRAQRYIFHEMYKWSLLPYAKGTSGFHEAEKKLDDEVAFSLQPGPWREVFPIVALLLPAVSRAKHAEVRLERHFAGLRALEAVRMHAAANDGKLPRSLDEITAVPVPNDPATDKPFAYRVDGDKAILNIPDRVTRRGAWRLEIRVAPSDESSSQ
jgi:hypothetical protein